MRILTVFLAVLAGPVAADGFGFRTPSGNIYCNGSLQGGAVLGCSIVNREAGSAPASVGSCPAGREFDVSLAERGAASGQCGGQSGRLSTYTDIADYGVAGSFGQINCQSEASGFSCTNADGHGFFLSKRSQQIY
jgi:hypothetical protein